jgi:hypothetical protein
MGQPEFHCKRFFNLCGRGVEKGAYVEVTVHDVRKVLECGWVDEKCGNEIDLPLKVWMSGELILPAVWYTALTKAARFPCKGRDKGAGCVSKLVWV